ncbi:MAG: ABC transporter ATP-binding protein [Ferruginibacter sp.]
MSEHIIEVENLSKLYKLGSLGTGTFSHDLNRWWSKTSKKEDPDMLAAEKNDRSLKSKSGYTWSLKDINFTVNQGEIFGIIGKNGAGKSTLLKILSKITKPTTGCIKIDGRIASLLEVGTGFHPELTGRENVFLNGAILGMKKNEIKTKFDEIVDFSGIGKYIDTPVKKYSSGMYVRLGFAIAANLEPDILIVDEVLAVGDAEFQKKCIGKMQDVSNKQGRTVLFVSHNIAAVKQLCTKGILLEYGETKLIGDIDEIVKTYQEEEPESEDGLRVKIPENVPGYFTEWKLENSTLKNQHATYTGDTCIFAFSFKAFESFKNCEARFSIQYDELLILHASSLSNNGDYFSIFPGQYDFKFKVDLPIRDASFQVTAVFLSGNKIIDTWSSNTKLTILDKFGSKVNAGVVNPDIKFSISDKTILVS